MSYIILEALTITRLIDLVNIRIDKGWIPQGGMNIAVVNSSFLRTGGVVYYQAMVKNDPH